MYHKFIIVILMLILGHQGLLSQCAYSGNETIICPTFSYEPTGSPSTCHEVLSCAGLNSGYLVVSVPDTILLDVIENEPFFASNYSGCVAVLPICYDLTAVQILVDIVINNGACCIILNSQSPGLCDSIRAHFTSGNDVQNLLDMVNLFRAFTGGDLTPKFMSNTLNMINDNIAQIAIFCTGVTAIGYCSDPVDFYSGNIDLFEINPDVCPFEDCIDSIEIKPVFLSTYPHQSTFRAIELISAEGIMSTDHIFKTQNEVILKPDFSTLEGAVLEIIIEDCVTTLLSVDPDK